jgi:hypothetical protein
MTDDDRKKVAAEAVRKAEIEEILKKKTWYVEARVGSENHGAEHIKFIDDKRHIAREQGGGYDNIPIETFIAGLMYERDEWKRRALAHGCQESGDADCG